MDKDLDRITGRVHRTAGGRDGGKLRRDSRPGRALALVLALVGLCGLAVPGCNRPGAAPTEFPIEKPPAVDAAGRALGQRLYRDRCQRCHGPRGGGDGPLAPTVNPRPQRLSDRIWQANVTNARLRRVVVYGGSAVNKSPQMPANPDLAAQPEAVDGLVAVIREFAAP